MAANPDTVVPTPLSARKAKSAPQPSSSPAEPKEPSGSETPGITDSTAQASPDRPLADAANLAARHEEIARVAYYMAEARGFAPGRELDDWLAAEQQIGLR